MTVIDDIYLTVSRVIALEKDESNEKDIGYGTGFFYQNTNKEVFLITNRHVIINEEKNFFPTHVKLILHSDPKNISQNIEKIIPLYNGTKKLWKETRPLIDVIAIPLDNEDIQNKKVIIKAFSKENLLPDNIKLQVGEDVLIIGYPLGIFYDSVYNLPVIRNGIVASAYPIPFNGNQYFLVDARLHKGTSGSPVLTKSKSAWADTEGNTMMGGFQQFLLGINSSTFPIPEGEEPLGLNATIFASIIDQLVS